jgi:hypothetical protein
MSQARKLPGIKKIELSVRQMRPPLNQDGTSPQLIGALDDGSPIYYGDVFAGNFRFADEAEQAHTKDPVMGPDGQVWRLNKSTGQKIMPVYSSRRRYKKAKYVMADHGNGNAGPMPVPTKTEKQEIGDDFDTLKEVLKAEGMTLKSFISMLKKNAVAEGEDDVSVEAGGGEGFPKPDAKGPWYTLSNGERVKGREAAIEAEAALAAPNPVEDDLKLGGWRDGG